MKETSGKEDSGFPITNVGNDRRGVGNDRRGAGMTGGAFLLNMNQHVVFRQMDINFRSMDMLNIHVFGYKSLY